MKLALALGSVFLGTLTASAATITSFSTTLLNTQIFTTTINTQFLGPTALITNSSVSCVSAGACSGDVLSFLIQGTGLTTLTPFLITIDGNLSGLTGTSGSVSLTSPITLTIPFSIAAGNFNTTILSSSIPALPSGAFSIAGTLGLSLGAGQTLTLPSSFAITVGSAVPEPGSMALLGAGLIGIALFRRRRMSTR